MMPERSHASIGASIGMVILVGSAAIALPSLMKGPRVRAQTQQQPIPNEPLQLPNHRYDLPATLLTAAQLEAHKTKMLADKIDDVPMNMVKAGGASDKHQVGISIVTRAKGQS